VIIQIRFERRTNTSCQFAEDADSKVETRARLETNYRVCPAVWKDNVSFVAHHGRRCLRPVCKQLIEERPFETDFRQHQRMLRTCSRFEQESLMTSSASRRIFLLKDPIAVFRDRSHHSLLSARSRASSSELIQDRFTRVGKTITLCNPPQHTSITD
jgi:hypothetical protein